MTRLEEDPHFALKRIPPVADGTRLKGAIVIARKDTDQVVARVTAYGKDAADLARQLQDRVRQRLAQLRRPVDFGKDPTVGRLVARFLADRDLLYGIEQRAQAETSPRVAAGTRGEGAQIEAHLHREIAARLAALTQAQRLDLVTATEEQLAHCQDGRMLDLLTAKRDLAGMLPSPTPQERAAMRRLQQALDDVPDEPTDSS